MFPTRHFCNRYFAPRYWPKVGATPAPVTDDTGSSALEHSAVAVDYFPRRRSSMRPSAFRFSLPRALPAGV